MLNHAFLIKTGIMLACMLLLLGCMYSWKKLKTDDNYMIGLPSTDSQAFIYMINNYLTFDKTHLLKQDDTFITTNENIHSDNRKITFNQYTVDDLWQYYTEMKKTDENLILKDDFMNHQQDIKDPQKWHLPNITMQDNNKLFIRTSLAEDTIDLQELGTQHGINLSDRLFVKLLSVSDDALLLQIDDPEKSFKEGRVKKCFVKQDLSHSVLIESTDQALQSFIKDDSFNDYKALFPTINNQDQYLLTYIPDTIINQTTSELINMNETDKLSIDGQYVYINGNKNLLADGQQTIQKTTDYLAGNDVDDATFDIDYRDISRQLDLRATDINMAHLAYFNEQYIVLYLKFGAVVGGSAGSTNVIIDLQEDKQNPTFYIVDLGLS